MGKKEILKDSEQYAESMDILKLNPDEKFVGLIVDGLVKNEEKYGIRYCPCRAVTEDDEENKRIVCPCTYHIDEVKNDGHCKCRLFVKE